jgi:toxin ParE1/3/4
MKYQLLIRTEAEQDLMEAFSYYERCYPNLGNEFILCVEDSFSKISRNPLNFPKIHKELRRKLIQRFPFSIFFQIIGTHIVVFGVLPQKGNPANWQSRL